MAEKTPNKIYWRLPSGLALDGAQVIVVETNRFCVHLVPGMAILCPPDGPHSEYWYQKDRRLGSWMVFDLDLIHTEYYHLPSIVLKAIKKLNEKDIRTKCAHKHYGATLHVCSNDTDYVSYFCADSKFSRVPKWLPEGEMFPKSHFKGNWVLAKEDKNGIHLEGNKKDLDKLQVCLLSFFCDKGHTAFKRDEIKWLFSLTKSYPFSVFTETKLPNFLRRVLSLEIKWDSDSVEGQFPDESIDRLFRLFLVRNKLIAYDKTDSVYSKAMQVLQCPLHELVYELYKLEPESLFRFVQDLYDILPMVIWGVISEYMDPYHVFWELLANYFSSL